MNSVNLSKRLEQVADYVKEGARLADIGSDHAYLPCYLAEKKQISYAVAGEVVKGPYENALKEVRRSGHKETVDVRLGNGLQVIESADQIDTVVIAGMGGALIRSILQDGQDQGRITGQETLILQPNVFEETVRQYLMKNAYKIEAETILEENGKIYEVIKAVPSKEPVTYSKQELLFGPFLGKEKTDIFRKKWAQHLKTDTFILKQIEQSKEPDEKKITQLKEEIGLIKEMIA
ncbi:putative tRNA-m1A22 methylase [Alkalibacterium sp. AK22]|uniref:tRNA (adenine(22)-N(1))-methyltransferase n=1 Tax=Alkalibacterium sp. AK22 TaxID=1229520 RepID=UPI00044764B3|nr:tRNA (adenine(22)-N(1))-methyltransferase TrmK [Alkalibacterium sp. AK22]EXJ22478.1 putative tRNA-m1A22 methylase [Alkalibacterium sp. AK22]